MYKMYKVTGSVVSISEAKAKLGELVREADTADVTLTRHGHPAAVILSARRYQAMLDRIGVAVDLSA